MGLMCSWAGDLDARAGGRRAAGSDRRASRLAVLDGGRRGLLGGQDRQTIDVGVAVGLSGV